MNYNKQKRILLNKLDRKTLELLTKYKTVIAGGAITSVFTRRPINDYDIYCKSIDDTILLVNELKKNYDIVSDTDNAYTLSHKNKKQIIQVIKYDKFCTDNINDIFKHFDFYHNMGAYDIEKGEFVLHEKFLLDNASNTITFNPGTDYPVCSLQRIVKYIDRGYKISGIELIKIALSIHNLSIRDYGELKEQLQGIDTLYLTDVTNELIKSPETSYDIDKIFEMFGDLDVEDNNEVEVEAEEQEVNLDDFPF